jgi:hypothetical protein
MRQNGSTILRCSKGWKDIPILVGSLLSFAVILALMVLLRMRNDKFEIKSSDAMIAVLPILPVTGKIKSFQLCDLKVESATVKASGKKIAEPVAMQQPKPLPVEQVRSQGKCRTDSPPH